jgi:hypothetical protein
MKKPHRWKATSDFTPSLDLLAYFFLGCRLQRPGHQSYCATIPSLSNSFSLWYLKNIEKSSSLGPEPVHEKKSGIQMLGKQKSNSVDDLATVLVTRCNKLKRVRGGHIFHVEPQIRQTEKAKDNFRSETARKENALLNGERTTVNGAARRLCAPTVARHAGGGNASALADAGSAPSWESGGLADAF